jgi:proton glutamate symport protein
VNAATRVLVALVAGLALGAWAATSDSARLASVIDGVGVVGTLWINAIRMTVIPLVAALTLTSVAGIGDAKSVGRLDGTAVITFVALLLASGAFGMLVVPPALSSLSFTADAAAKLAEYREAAPAAAAMPSLMQRIIDMVPVNPVKAAADGSILPLVVFSLALGLALSQVAAEKRDAVLAVVRTISDAMLVLIEWILRAAPIGVFALALVLGLRVGVDAVGAIVQYLVVLSGALFAYTLLLYPVAVLVGRVSPFAFAAAALPAQVVAFSTRSSLASLPAQIAGARDTLKLPASSTGFVLPLAVSVFRLNVPIAWIVGVIFLGELYGVPITQGQLAMLVVTSTLLSFSVPGIPSASLLLVAPVLVQNGLPAEGVAILIALDAIPDMFKTTANVTAHMTSAVVVARFARAGKAPGA